MSAMKAVLDELHAIVAKAKATGDTVAADIEALFHKLSGSAPALEHEAETDAADVVKTAETEGVPSAEHEAVGDAKELATETGHDVQAAAETAVQPAHTPQQTAAVIAGEAAVAATETGHSV